MDESGFPPPIVIVPKVEFDPVDINENPLLSQASISSVKTEVQMETQCVSSVMDTSPSSSTMQYNVWLYPCPLCILRFQSKTDVIAHHQVRK